MPFCNFLWLLNYFKKYIHKNKYKGEKSTKALRSTEVQSEHWMAVYENQRANKTGPGMKREGRPAPHNSLPAGVAGWRGQGTGSCKAAQGGHGTAFREGKPGQRARAALEEWLLRWGPSGHCGVLTALLCGWQQPETWLWLFQLQNTAPWMESQTTPTSSEASTPAQG